MSTRGIIIREKGVNVVEVKRETISTASLFFVSPINGENQILPFEFAFQNLIKPHFSPMTFSQTLYIYYSHSNFKDWRVANGRLAINSRKKVEKRGWGRF